MPAGCLFCDIASGASPAAVVRKDQDLTAFRDVNPQAPTHILIIPNRHLSSLDAATEGDQQLLGKLLLVAADLARQEGLAKNGYRLVVNAGPGAGQSVQHIHVHLLGGRSMRWPPG